MIGEVLSFLIEHLSLITAIKEAIDSGASNDSLLKAIRESQIAASDAIMHAELDE